MLESQVLVEALCVPPCSYPRYSPAPAVVPRLAGCSSRTRYLAQHQLSRPRKNKVHTYVQMHPLTEATAESRARKRFQRPTAENEDPLRKSSIQLPFARTNNASTQDPKMSLSQSQHARRRSTLRDNNRPLLGPRPLESKRYIPLLYYS